MICFYKMSGAGNDFVLVAGIRKNLPALARRLCDRRAGVGADGLLVIDRRGPRLRYFNADGSPAFCGNGSRCAAWWLHEQGWIRGKEFSFATDEGPLKARIIASGRVSIRMPEPSAFHLGLKVSALGKKYTVYALDTGVPHAVVPVKDIAHFPVFEVGRALRRHKAFAPKGANVDFVLLNGKAIHVRTYERGVEDETLACGTGVTASALAAALLGKAKSPVRVHVRGGAVLTVSFKRAGPAFKDVWLEGPARVVYAGKIIL